MAIGDDFAIDGSGNITHVSGTTTYTVLAFHRWLQDLADDVQASSGDLVDITTATPSERSTDNIITLNSPFNIDDTAAEYLYDGSITQAGGDTVYSGLVVVGSLYGTTTLQVVQNNALYDGATPFWGTGLNADAANNILSRFLVKTRDNGHDVDGQKIRVFAREWNETFAEFEVQMGEGNSTAAIFTLNDLNNQTAVGTVGGWTTIVNSGGTATDPTGGYQQIDLGNGNGDRDYYSKWDTGSQSVNDTYERAKWLTYRSTTGSVDGITGELFRGITHEIDYDTEVGGPFQERETIAWGTHIWYDALSGGTFTEGNYVTIGSSGAAGRIGYDDGVDEMYIALEDTSITLLDNDAITEYSVSTWASTGVSATLDTGAGGGSPVENNSDSGGSGVLLALDDNGVDGTFWIQLTTGSAPVDGLPMRGLTSTAEADVDITITSRAVSAVFMGVSTGSNIIGAYGIGFDPNDVTNNDTFFDLTNTQQTPPNNVTWTIGNLIDSETRVIVGPKDTGDAIDYDQLSLSGTLNGPGVTSVVVAEAIPSDTPSAGTIRIVLDDGRHRRIAYTSWDTSTFTIASTDFSDPDDATTGNDVYITYIDDIAGAPEELEFTAVYSTDRSLWVRVRDGGSTPLKTFETASTFGSADSTLLAVQTSDA